MNICPFYEIEKNIMKIKSFRMSTVIKGSIKNEFCTKQQDSKAWSVMLDGRSSRGSTNTPQLWNEKGVN